MKEKNNSPSHTHAPQSTPTAALYYSWKIKTWILIRRNAILMILFSSASSDFSFGASDFVITSLPIPHFLWLNRCPGRKTGTSLCWSNWFVGKTKGHRVCWCWHPTNCPHKPSNQPKTEVCYRKRAVSLTDLTSFSFGNSVLETYLEICIQKVLKSFPVGLWGPVSYLKHTSS